MEHIKDKKKFIDYKYDKAKEYAKFKDSLDIDKEKRKRETTNMLWKLKIEFQNKTHKQSLERMKLMGRITETKISEDKKSTKKK